MFANFNYDNYEKKNIVKVVFDTNIIDDNDFDNFLNSWIQLYNLKKDFTFIFDTTNVGYVPIKYSFKMSAFIKNLKRNDYQYLQKSIILVKSNFVKNMLDIIFYIQPPVAPVYLTQNKEDIQDILNGNIPHNVVTILPGKSFLNLF
tara:strand:+ start:101 stop:538 length:438 start_codon:yes stop_codon:yes gene_type:complete